MTVPAGESVSPITFTSYLPDPLPDGQGVKDAAKVYETNADTMDEAYQDANTTWGELSGEGVLTIPEPDMQTMVTALRDNVEPLGAALYDGLIALKGAMDTYGTSLTGFEPTHSNPKSRVEAFNNLPARQYSSTQRAEATEEGTILPATRTPSARYALVSDLNTAKETYEGYIDTCVAAIDEATPTVMKDGPKNLAENVALIKKSYGLATTWVDRGASFRGAGQGRMRFIWRADAKTLSGFVHEGVPGWKDVHTEGSLTNRFLPRWFKDQIPDAGSFADKSWVKSMDAWYESGVQRMSHAADHYRGALMAAMPTSVLTGLNKIKNSKAGRFVQLNSVKKVNGKWKVEFNVGGRSSAMIPDRVRAQMGKFDNAKKFLDKAGNSKLLKYGGKAFGALDFGATYYKSYGENYNEALRANPDATEGQIRHEAGVSTAIEGTAENAGKVVGGVVGRAAGAAVGQALIPIPGVGAAVGGFVGGVIGDYVGGKVGAAAGEFINDWRQGGAGKAFGDAGKAIGDTGEKVVDGIKDVGKSIGKKLFGW